MNKLFLSSLSIGNTFHIGNLSPLWGFLLPCDMGLSPYGGCWMERWWLREGTVLFPWLCLSSRQLRELLIFRHMMSFFLSSLISFLYISSSFLGCSLSWRLAVACSWEIAPYLFSFPTSLNNAGSCRIGADRHARSSVPLDTPAGAFFCCSVFSSWLPLKIVWLLSLV